MLWSVLSPFLFTLYILNFRYIKNSCHPQKFSEDSVIVVCAAEYNDLEYLEVITSFVVQGGKNNLQMNEM